MIYSANEILKTTLQNIITRLQDYENLNYGGCCYIAYLIAKKLEVRNIKFKVVFEHPSEHYETYIDQANANTKGYGVYHVRLKISNYYFDSDGIKHKLHKDKVFFNWNAKQIHNFWVRGRWNPWFKNSNPPINRQNIRAIINEEFKNYDKDRIRYR